MRDLLLTHGYFLFEDPKEQQIMKPYAPLGILYICSHLRGKGFDVDFSTPPSHAAKSCFASCGRRNPRSSASTQIS